MARDSSNKETAPVPFDPLASYSSRNYPDRLSSLSDARVEEVFRGYVQAQLASIAGTLEMLLDRSASGDCSASVAAEIAKLRASMDALPGTVAASMRTVFDDSLLDFIDDDDRLERFWAHGYEQLSKHASTNASLWIGKRIIIALATAAFVLSITWLVKSGNLK